MSKNFFDYLVESKRQYEFKIKIAHDTSDDTSDIISDALEKYNVVSCEQATRSPIQKRLNDFPTYSNTSVTLFDLVTDYPATTPQLRSDIAEALSLPQDCIIVRTCSEHFEEYEINNAEYQSETALLLTDYEKSNHQDLVGSKKMTGLLKELGKEKHTGTQYKGVNDKLLAKKAPSTSVEYGKSSADKQPSSKSPIGSTLMTKPTARGK